MRIIRLADESKVSVPAGAPVLLVDLAGAAADISIALAADARAQYVCLAGKKRAEKRTLILGSGSALQSFELYLGEGRAEVEHRLDEGAQLESRALACLGGTEKLSVADKYIFSSPRSRGRFLVEGIMEGEAELDYHADLVISALAQKTDSRIDMKLYLLGARAQGRILPGLEIAANEVAAGHGASTFRLGPEDLFYLASRGLSAEAAKNLIVKAVIRRFTAGVGDARIRAELDELIAAKRSM